MDARAIMSPSNIRLILYRFFFFYMFLCLFVCGWVVQIELWHALKQIYTQANNARRCLVCGSQSDGR